MQIYISRDGQSLGPYTAAQTNEMLQNGTIATDDLIWVQSGDWERVSALSWLFGSHTDSSPGISAPSFQPGTTDRLVKPISAVGSGGLSAMRANGRGVRPNFGADSEGTDNLMKDAFDL
jgi:hypothetical protein